MSKVLVDALGGEDWRPNIILSLSRSLRRHAAKSMGVWQDRAHWRSCGSRPSRTWSATERVGPPASRRTGCDRYNPAARRCRSTGNGAMTPDHLLTCKARVHTANVGIIDYHEVSLGLSGHDPGRLASQPMAGLKQHGHDVPLSPV